MRVHVYHILQPVTLDYDNNSAQVFRQCAVELYVSHVTNVATERGRKMKHPKLITTKLVYEGLTITEVRIYEDGSYRLVKRSAKPGRVIDYRQLQSK